MAMRLSRFKKLVDCLVGFNRISNMSIENEMESKTGLRYEFKLYGWIGIFLIVIAELAVVFQHSSYIAHRIGVWTTPLCWWGYLFLIDG